MMADPKKKLPKKNSKTGFEYKKLDYIDAPKLEMLPEDTDIKVAIEKPAATMYGYPAQMQSKSTPLNKKGKMSPCYKTGGPFEGEFKLNDGEPGEGFIENKKGIGSVTLNFKNPFKKKIKQTRKVSTKF